MLAYVTALDLPGGMLIYAKGEAEPVMHEVRHSGKRLEVVALDLSGSLEDVLVESSRPDSRLGSEGYVTRMSLSSPRNAHLCTSSLQQTRHCLPRQAPDRILVYVDAEAGAVGDRHVAVDLVEGGLHQALADF